MSKRLKLALVSAFPPGRQSLNEYGYHLALNLAQRDDVEEVIVLADKLAKFIDQVNREEDIGFVIIEHDMKFIMQIADPIIVLDQGSILVEGPPEAVQNDDRVVDAYLGGPE